MSSFKQSSVYQTLFSSYKHGVYQWSWFLPDHGSVVSNINFYVSGLLSSTNLIETCQANSRLSTCPPGELWDAHFIVPWGWFGMAFLRLTLMVWTSPTSLHGVQNKSLGLLSHHWQDNMISAYQNNIIGILFLRYIGAWEWRASLAMKQIQNMQLHASTARWSPAKYMKILVSS